MRSLAGLEKKGASESRLLDIKETLTFAEENLSDIGWTIGTKPTARIDAKLVLQ